MRPSVEDHRGRSASDFLGSAVFRAALLAPLASLAAIVVGSAFYLRLPLLVLSPILWLFAGVVGLPMLYAAEVFVALPLWVFMRRHVPIDLASCVVIGLISSVFPTWMWTEVIRYGPIPGFREFGVVIVLTAPAGALGGAVFWNIAAHADPAATEPARTEPRS